MQRIYKFPQSKKCQSKIYFCGFVSLYIYFTIGSEGAGTSPRGLFFMIFISFCIDFLFLGGSIDQAPGAIFLVLTMFIYEQKQTYKSAARPSESLRNIWISDPQFLTVDFFRRCGMYLHIRHTYIRARIE